MIPHPTRTLTPLATPTFSELELAVNACPFEQYIVQENDTLSSIATSYNISLETIMEWNGLTTDTVFLAQFIFIPMCEIEFDGPSELPTIDEDLLTTTQSGLQYQDLIMGDGEAATEGDILLVHYTGWFTNGTQFDSSYNRATPYEFNLGLGEVIAGWDEGVAGIREGGVRLLVISPELGYGDQDHGPIPANSTLIFWVKLLEIN